MIGGMRVSWETPGPAGRLPPNSAAPPRTRDATTSCPSRHSPHARRPTAGGSWFGSSAPGPVRPWWGRGTGSASDRRRRRSVIVRGPDGRRPRSPAVDAERRLAYDGPRCPARLGRRGREGFVLWFGLAVGSALFQVL